jgi:AcrR family transcriptional regulator
MKTRALPIRRRDEILEVSAKLFRQKGYSATTMREIAEQVGMEAASMYNYIKGKEEILQEICFRVADEYGTQMNSIDSSADPPVQKLEQLIRTHIRIVCQDLNAISVANNDWKHLPEPALGNFKKARQAYEKRMAMIIQDGIDREELNDVNVSITLYTILSAIRWVEVWYNPGKQVSPALLENTIVQILMNGLKKVM